MTLDGSGRSVEDGQSWWDGCRRCFCHDGHEMCSLISCPTLRCINPVLRSGSCCPSCPGTVTHLHGRQCTSDIGGRGLRFLHVFSLLSLLPVPFNPARGSGGALPQWVRAEPGHQTHSKAKIKRFRGHISYIFNTQNLKVLLEICSTMAPTTQSIMMTKIVHHTRDCVGIIGGVQHTDRLLQVKYW